MSSNKSGPTEFKASSQTILEGGIEGRMVKGLVSVIGNLDEGYDRIHSGAFRKTIKEGQGRVRHLWQHDYEQPPIAVIKELKEVKAKDLPSQLTDQHPEVTGGLLVVREYLRTPRGDEVLEGITSGAITQMSIGYDPIKFDFEEEEEKGIVVRNLRELRLWDTSDVNWGMNELTQAVAKTAIPFKDTGAADEGADWSGPSLSDFTGESFEDLSEGERKRIAAHFAFSTNWPPETYGDLKLPHHLPSKSGVGQAIWAGVSAAMAALLGARGGVDLPEADRKAVYNHLKKHYSAWDKEPPDFKFVTLASLLEDILRPGQPELPLHWMWKERRPEGLHDAIAELHFLIASAESGRKGEDKASRTLLTESLKLRLRIAETYLMDM